MAYDQYLADRIQQALKEKSVTFEIKKMFGGLCYMIDNKMCIGTSTDKITGIPRLIARVGHFFYNEALEKDHCTEFNITGRPLKGFVMISAEGVDTDVDLQYWIQKCLDYNPNAKRSKK